MLYICVYRPYYPALQKQNVSFCHKLGQVIIVNPCELNAAITALTNHFYCNLSKEEFICLSIFLNELSKSMFATSLFRDLCAPKETPPS